MSDNEKLSVTDRRLLKNGEELIVWAWHSRRYGRWKKTEKRNDSQYWMYDAKVRDYEAKRNAELRKAQPDKKRLKILREQIASCLGWRDGYHKDLHRIRPQVNMELRRKMRAQKRLAKKGVTATTWAYQRLRELVMEDRQRISKGEEPRAGPDIEELIFWTEWIDKEDEVEQKVWPPDDEFLEDSDGDSDAEIKQIASSIAF